MDPSSRRLDGLDRQRCSVPSIAQILGCRGCCMGCSMGIACLCCDGYGLDWRMVGDHRPSAACWRATILDDTVAPRVEALAAGGTRPSIPGVPVQVSERVALLGWLDYDGPDGRGPVVLHHYHANRASRIHPYWTGGWHDRRCNRAFGHASHAVPPAGVSESQSILYKWRRRQQRTAATSAFGGSA